MCTLVALYEANESYPLIVYANRDEKYARPSTVPKIMKQEGREIVVAPLDHISGGTWIGASSRGFIAAITNQDCDSFDPQALSRGQVVAHVLTLNDTIEATKYLLSLRPESYNPFNLLFGTPFNLRLATVHRGQPVQVQTLEPGTHVFSNDMSGEGLYNVKAERCQRLASGIRERSSLKELMTKGMTILSDHENAEPDPYQAVCVHMAERGTRSTSMIVVPRHIGGLRFFHSEGPTCKSGGLAEYTHLFEV